MQRVFAYGIPSAIVAQHSVTEGRSRDRRRELWHEPDAGR